MLLTSIMLPLHRTGWPYWCAAIMPTSPRSSPVMVTVAGSPMLTATDASLSSSRSRGALAYLDAVGARADDAALSTSNCKRMRLVLTSRHALHNQMHERGTYHGCETPPNIVDTLTPWKSDPAHLPILSRLPGLIVDH